MSYYIYKDFIKGTPYYYSGSSNDKYRLSTHNRSCFNPNYNGYEMDFYKKVRELGITRETFKDRIEERIYIRNLTKEEARKGEGSLQDLSDPNCLNQRKEGINYRDNRNEYEAIQRLKPERIAYQSTYYETNKISLKADMKSSYLANQTERLKKAKAYRDANKSKVNAKITCDVCGKTISKRGLKRHKKGKGCVCN